MSDISIPGIKSKYNTEEIIKNLVEVEKIPLKRMEESVNLYKTQAGTWREINQGLTRLRESARGLFGFQSPFGDRTAVSSDPRVISAAATREAAEGRITLEIRKIASGDKFLSRDLDLDHSIPQGRYGFRVGEEEFRFNFRGGKLSAFAQALNDRAAGLVRAQVVRNTPNSQVLLIESLKTGSANPLTFLDDSTALGERTGMIERDFAGSRTVSLVPENLRSWDRPMPSPGTVLRDGSLFLGSGSEIFVPVTPAMSVTDNMVLEMDVKVTFRREDVYTAPSPPPGPALTDIGPATLGDVSVQGSPSKVVLPEWKAPEPPKMVEDPRMIFLGTGGEPVPLPPLQDSPDFVRMRIPLKDYGNNLSGIYFRNNNTLRDLEAKDLRVFDPTSRGEHRPVNPVSTAADAELVMNGITIRRQSNAIDDLLPGVTINLLGTGTSPVELSVEPDREKIKDGIIQFVGYYNQMIANINILTRKDENVIQEISYLSKEEQDKAREKLGLFQGDLTLMQMRNAFQGIMMNPYPTVLGRDLSLLAQMGISTNTRQGGGAGLDVSKLRGYLEINEPLLDENLLGNLAAVRDMFGSDANGDLIADTGAAVVIDNYIRPMVQTAGILSMKTTTLESQISQTNRRIDNYNQYLERFESDLKRKYGAMEGALGNLEKSSQTIENFNRNNSNSR